MIENRAKKDNTFWAWMFNLGILIAAAVGVITLQRQRPSPKTGAGNA
jgi:hypothetical protein